MLVPSSFLLESKVGLAQIALFSCKVVSVIHTETSPQRELIYIPLTRITGGQ